jgi:hypothetical protein
MIARADAAWGEQLRAPAVVLEGMNDSDGNVITPEYSVSAAMQSSALAIKHYPDPQAMPDAKLILSTENADAAALRRLRTMAFKVHQMRTKASDTGRRWMNMLEKARDIEYSTLDMESETPTLRKPRGEIGPPGPPGPQGVRSPPAVPWCVVSLVAAVCRQRGSRSVLSMLSACVMLCIHTHTHTRL